MHETGIVQYLSFSRVPSFKLEIILNGRLSTALVFHIRFLFHYTGATYLSLFVKILVNAKIQREGYQEPRNEANRKSSNRDEEK